MNSRNRWIAAVTLAATLLGGCTNAGAPPVSPVATSTTSPSASPVTSNAPAPPASPNAGTKAGGNPGPVRITVADSQPPGRPSNLPLAEFKTQVETLSGGSITVTILVLASHDADPPDSDGPIIEGVKSGEFQMAVVPARAWSAAGVTTLKALQAPFLIESEEHVTALMNDPVIARDLLAGLESVGVTGLALFPESLRHFFSFTTPILKPGDVKGRKVRAISSLETTAMIEALGGEAVDPDSDTFAQGVADGIITAADSSFSIASSSTPRPATVTGNLVLYPKIITLVMNGAFWTGLDEAQRGIISTAAAATRAWAIANVTPDAQAALDYCKDGGTVVLADAASLDAFRAAEAPVYAALEADPATKQVITAIRALAAGPAKSDVAPCVSSAESFVPDGGQLPEGIYRIEATEKWLTSQGVTDWTCCAGIYTFALRNGFWTFDFVNDGGKDHQAGIYRAQGDDIQWLWDPCCSHPNPVLYWKWSVDAKGTLHFKHVAGPPDWTLPLPFVRVGDLPPETDNELDGIYRVEYTDEYLTSNGVTDPSDVDENHGVYTMTLKDGRWSGDQVADNPIQNAHGEGTYRVVGSELFWSDPRDGSRMPVRLTWRKDAKGNLIFAPAPGEAKDWGFGLPWTRVSDAP